mgnify:CR=1 FL=1
MIQKKICLLGASSVGKTSLVKQFVECIFDAKYLTTIGVKIDKKANRLIDEKSPYLLQHAFNPVDWFPWGNEAFEKAKAESKCTFSMTSNHYSRSKEKSKLDQSSYL